MAKTNIKNSPYVVFENDSLQKTMEVITHNHKGCVVVVNEKYQVLGTVADGEIRRAIIKGATPVTPVARVLNINFISISSNDTESIKSHETILSQHTNINVIPVVSEDNILVDIIVRSIN